MVAQGPPTLAPLRQSRGRILVYTSVCLFAIPDDISKIDAARITKLDIQMFHDESWKPIFSTWLGPSLRHVQYVMYFRFCG